MVAPLLCGSLLGGLPALTIVAFFAATLFRNSSLPEIEPVGTPLTGEQFRPLTLQQAAPFLLFLALLCIDILLRVFHGRQMKALDAERADALAEAARLRVQAGPLETPDTFVDAAKLKRRAAIREKHAEELAALKERQARVAFIKLLRYARTAAVAGYVYWSWGEPTAAIDARLLWPLQGTSAALPEGPSSIRAAGWALICGAASGRVADLLA